MVSFIEGLKVLSRYFIKYLLTVVLQTDTRCECLLVSMLGPAHVCWDWFQIHVFAPAVTDQAI